MVNYHKLCKILERKDIDSEIEEVLIWLKSKLEIDEERKEHIEYLRKNLEDNLNKLIQKEEYIKQDLYYTMEDYIEYKTELNTTECYHCRQTINNSVEDKLREKVDDFLYTYYQCYDYDYNDLPSTEKIRELLNYIRLDIK